MRELKFRAWDKRQQKMSRLDDLRWRNVGTPAEQLETQMMVAANFAIMQFTGLKDKNGKEIYEGDILKISGGLDSERRNIVVRFAAGGFIVEDDFSECDILTIGWAIQEWDAGEETCEIIGNIYDNPELLK